MAPSDLLGETWPNLCLRVDAAQLQRWSVTEPVLGAFTELAALAVGTHSADERACVDDDVFGALLRLAAYDNGDDQDAALVVAHLMDKGSRAIASSLRDLSPDIEAMVTAELWMQIRSYRWRRRRHGHALGLKNDTRRALLRELVPAYDRVGRRRQVSVSPQIATWLTDTRITPLVTDAPASCYDVADELLDVLSWAQGSGVLREKDVQLLLEFELAALPQRCTVAAEWGLSDRQMRRRCGQLKQRLHDARLAYLDHAA